MPSPFPGMNPYLEQDDAWHNFHQQFIPLVGQMIVPQVRPSYIVKVEEHVFIHERSAVEREFLGRADVSVERGETSRHLLARARKFWRHQSTGGYPWRSMWSASPS